MNRYKTIVFWSEEDQEYVAKLDGVSGFEYVSALASTKEDAIKLLDESIEDYIEDMKERGFPIPEPQSETTKQD
jgi:predicted RNase H-like HicB family nuclease